IKMENTESRLYFASDYMEGAHPAIMKKLMETNLEKTVGYGQDPYTEDAKEKIRQTCNGSCRADQECTEEVWISAFSGYS
ncbi:hypothetical protein LIP94_19360, partial [Erysipelatoclostridium ramosum]|nr:hypothetical protein [Thomasclavelia ramosa]